MAFTRYRDSDSAFYNVALSAYEAYNVAHIADYAIPATEVGATGVYEAVDPTPTVAGSFEFINLLGVTMTLGDIQDGVWGGGHVDIIEPIGTEWISADSLSNEATQKITDIFHRRTMENVEASSYGDTLNVHSLYGFIQQAQKFSATPTEWTIKKTDGSDLGVLTLTVSAGDSLIRGVS